MHRRRPWSRSPAPGVRDGREGPRAVASKYPVMGSFRGGAAALIGIAVVAAMLTTGSTGAEEATFAFTDPVQLPAPGKAREASVDVAPDGRTYAVAIDGTTGSQRFVSENGGESFEFAGTMAMAEHGGGRDADVAVAPEPNASGHHTVWMIDLWQYSVDLEVSTDGGESWESFPLAALLPGFFPLFSSSAPVHERPWIAAVGSSEVYVSYNTLGHFVVKCSLEPVLGCGVPVQAADYPPVGPSFPRFPGGFTHDPVEDRLYQAYLATGSAGPRSQVWVGVSADGGLTWEQVLVHEDPDGRDLANFFPVPRTDPDGNAYVTWSNGIDVKLAASTDGGESWGPAVRVNQSPSEVAVEPWLATGSPGIVDLVWYGADALDGSWFPYFAQVRGAVSEGSPNADPSIAQAALTDEPLVEGIELGRLLLDFFGVAVDPTDGGAVTAYTSAFGHSFSTRQCSGPSAIEGLSVTPC